MRFYFFFNVSHNNKNDFNTYIYSNEFTTLKGKKHKYKHIWRNFKLEILIFLILTNFVLHLRLGFHIRFGSYLCVIFPISLKKI
jgi:hypothetical protein